MIAEILNFIFLPVLEEFGKQGFVIFMSLSLIILTSLFYKKAIPQKATNILKKELTRLNTDLKNNIGNGEIFDKINREISNKKLKHMSYTIGPTILVLIPMFMLFPWMNATVPGEIIVLFGLEIGWIIIYIFISLVIGSFIRKALGA